MEEARIKMVGDESWAKENVVSGILRLVKENGIFSTFGGLPAMLCKQVSDGLVLSKSLIHYWMHTTVLAWVHFDYTLPLNLLLPIPMMMQYLLYRHHLNNDIIHTNMHTYTHTYMHMDVGMYEATMLFQTGNFKKTDRVIIISHLKFQLAMGFRKQTNHDNCA